MARRAALLAAAFASAQALYTAADVDIVQATEATFDKIIKAPGLHLVEFYAPWCGHCKNLAPEWKKAAKALKGLVNVVAVDADAHKGLAGKYGVQGFPTIKLFGAGGAPVAYEGAREAPAIVKYATEQVAALARKRLGGKAEHPSKDSKAAPRKAKAGGGGGGGGHGDASAPGGGKAVVALTPDNFDEMVFGGDAWIVEFYAPWCGHCKNLAPEWAAAAETAAAEGGARFGAVDADAHKALAQRFGIKGFPTIKTFAAGAAKDGDARDYNGGRTASDLAAAAAKLAGTGGGAPAKVAEITSPAAFAETCAGRVCVLAALPHILDDGAKKRAARIATLAEVAGGSRGKPLRFGWFEAGAHPKLEAALGGGMAPAAYAVAADKGVFTKYLGTLEAKPLGAFAAALLSAKPPAGAAKFAAGFDAAAAVEAVAAWDGKDGKPIEEEPLDKDDAASCGGDADDGKCTAPPKDL